MRLEAATAASELAEGQDSESPIEPAIAVEPLLTLEGIDDAPAANDSYAEDAPVGQVAAPRADAEPTAPAALDDETIASGEVVEVAGLPCRRRAGAARSGRRSCTRRRGERGRRRRRDPRDRFEAAPSVFGGLGSFNALGVAELKPLARRRPRRGAPHRRGPRPSARSTTRSTPSMRSTPSCSRSSRKKRRSCCPSSTASCATGLGEPANQRTRRAVHAHPAHAEGRRAPGRRDAPGRDGAPARDARSSG